MPSVRYAIGHLFCTTRLIKLRPVSFLVILEKRTTCHIATNSTVLEFRSKDVYRSPGQQKKRKSRFAYKWYDIFICNWVATRWQLFSTHIHTNNTGNVTKQTIHRTTQKIHRAIQQLGRVRVVPRLCGFYPGICLTTEEKNGKPSVRVVKHKHTVRIHVIPITVIHKNPKIRVVTYKLFLTVHSSLRLRIKKMYVILRLSIYYSGGLSSDAIRGPSRYINFRKGKWSWTISDASSGYEWG
jgi:hypothetical protein